jgi:hypothetical protein
MAARPTRHVTADQEREAWRLRTVDRLRESEIAEQLGVSQGTVSRMLGRVERRLAQAFQEEAFRAKARQTALLEHVVGEALAAWERSKQDAERRGLAASPAFLAECRAALAGIREIWGLNAPARQDVTSGGRPVKALIGVDPDAL